MRFAPHARLMPRIIGLGFAAFVVAAGSAGCGDRSPPPARVPVPPPLDQPRMFERDPVKPLPGETTDSQLVAPPYNDAPLVNQRPPEEPAFLEAYNRVGRPRIIVLTTADNIDDQAMEESLADTLGCNGQVILISPELARRFMGDRAAHDLRRNPEALRDLAQQVNADVLVQAQEQQTGRRSDGAPVRVIVDAMNTRGAQSLGRAVIDVPPPLDAPRIDHFTRYVARKLMDEMTAAWNAPPPPELRRDNPRESTTPAPGAAPGATAPGATAPGATAPGATAPSSPSPSPVPPTPPITTAPATQPSP